MLDTHNRLATSKILLTTGLNVVVNKIQHTIKHNETAFHYSYVTDLLVVGHSYVGGVCTFPPMERASAVDLLSPTPLIASNKAVLA